MEYALVALGGSFGALARFLIARKITERARTSFPWGTMVVNIAGATLLGMALATGIGGSAYILVIEGFLGAFTTFSTFMFEGFTLFQENERSRAIVYILVSLGMSIIGFLLGAEAVRIVGKI